MAASSLISLGLGSPGDIPHFLLFGLNPGDAPVVSDPVFTRVLAVACVTPTALNAAGTGPTALNAAGTGPTALNAAGESTDA